MMGPASNEYLYTLAVVAVTFVGFSTIFATFRQALGGTISKYDLLLTRSILHLGLMVVLGALLPSLLALLGLRANLILRVASGVSGTLVLVFNATYPARRRAATGAAMPKKVWIVATLIYIVAAVLLANAAGAPIRSSVASHALGLTLLLFATVLAFLFGLDLLPRQRGRPVRKEVASTKKAEAASK